MLLTSFLPSSNCFSMTKTLKNLQSSQKKQLKVWKLLRHMLMKWRKILRMLGPNKILILVKIAMILKKIFLQMKNHCLNLKRRKTLNLIKVIQTILMMFCTKIPELKVKLLWWKTMDPSLWKMMNQTINHFWEKRILKRLWDMEDAASKVKKLET